MTQGQVLLYWILNALKKPLYINRSGHVEAGEGVLKTDGTPAHTQSSPTGWSETLIKYSRNIKYLGLFRDYSVPLTTVRDIAKILRDAKWKLGMEAVLYLSIVKLDQYSFPDKYDQWYTGEFDLSKFKQTDTGVDIQLVEGGLSKILKANEGTTYEIDVKNDPDRFTVYLDGLTFKNNVESEIYNQFVFSDAVIGGGDYWAVGLGIISNEGTTQGIVSNDQNAIVEQPLSSDNAFLKSFTKTTIIHVSGTARVSVGNNDEDFDVATNLKLSIEKYNSKGEFITFYAIVPTQDIHRDTIISVSYSFDIPVEPDTMLTLYAVTGIVGSTPPAILNIVGTLNYNYDVRFDPTLCEAMSWWTLFQRLTAKLTGGKYGCRSSFLRGLVDQCVTSGQCIRKFHDLDPTHPQVIKTSIEDFFKACQRWGVGLTVENDELVIERHEYFFRKGISIELGEVKDVEWSDAEDLDFNTIKVGYLNQTYDNVNGRDEFNVTQGYTTPITRIVKELDLICPYRADMFGIELTRLRLFQKDTTDSDADNDTFIMNVIKGSTYDIYRGPFTTEINTGNYYIKVPNTEVPFTVGELITFTAGTFTIENVSYIIDGYAYIQVLEAVTNASFNESISTSDPNVYHLNRPAFTSITGLLKPDEAFNVLLSPKGIINNNAAYIHSILDLQESGKVVFQTGEKNSDLSYTLDGVTVTEKADLNINSLPAQLFRPYYIKFTTKVPIDLPAKMKAQPYDRVGFIYQGNHYYGYLWDGGIAPATQDSQQWTLLSAAENDLRKLI